jgi:hypothetical protein
MPPSMVGLLPLVGSATSILVSVAHGGLFWAASVIAAAAMGLAAYAALPDDVPPASTKSMARVGPVAAIDMPTVPAAR